MDHGGGYSFDSDIFGWVCVTCMPKTNQRMNCRIVQHVAGRVMFTVATGGLGAFVGEIWKIQACASGNGCWLGLAVVHFHAY